MALKLTCDLRSSAPQSAWSWPHLLLLVLLVVVSLSTRLLSAQDARVQGSRVHPAVVRDYKAAGRIYLGNFTSFFSDNSPLKNPDLLAHPPGYSLIWAFLFKLGFENRSMQLIQTFCDVLSVLVLFFIASELLPRSIAVIAAFMAAVAPQFTWNSAILLPDTLAVFPLLLAIYCLILALKKQRVAAAVMTGVFIGVSCWLRPNALLLAPFACLFLPMFLPRGMRLCYAAAVLSGAVLVIAPLTIRNALVFHRFVPLSLGAGQTVLEGIADYDPERRFGVPNSDIEIMREEAQAASRPDYADTLFGPDGIERERARFSRAFRIIKGHPIWFAGVMVQRAISMLRLERAPKIESNSLSNSSLSEPASPSWTRIPRLFFSSVQRLFITAVALPLFLIGLVVLVRARCFGTLGILVLVPMYYLCIQSPIHTEYRYVLAIQWFFFIIVATGVWFLGAQALRLVNKRSQQKESRESAR
jgi:4-amino-4-deoxy-L-arabinose transferase-like glycosyltransferase